MPRTKKKKPKKKVQRESITRQIESEYDPRSTTGTVHDASGTPEYLSAYNDYMRNITRVAQESELMRDETGRKIIREILLNIAHNCSPTPSALRLAHCPQPLDLFPANRPLSLSSVWTRKEIERILHTRDNVPVIEFYTISAAYRLLDYSMHAESMGEDFVMVVDLNNRLCLNDDQFRRIMFWKGSAVMSEGHRGCSIVYYKDNYATICMSNPASRRESRLHLETILLSSKEDMECCVCMEGAFCFSPSLMIHHQSTNLLVLIAHRFCR